MSEENTIIEEETVETVQETEPEAPEAKTDEIDPIEAAVQERLKQMKDNMDRMVRERDEALKAKAEVEQAQKAAEIERLEAEGKLKEALEMKLAEANAKLKVFEEENTKLNRDNVVNSQLATLEFRNERSRQMAQRDIVEQLVQNENGAWVHKSGSSIQEFIDSYSKSEDNEFLFRVKANSGSGTATPAAQAPSSEAKSISQMTTEEILNMAAKGQLGNFGV